MAFQSASDALAKFDRAHAALLRSRDLQFRLDTQPDPAKSPFQEWFKAHVAPYLDKIFGPLGRLIGPVAPYVFWIGLALGLGVILFLVASHFMGMKPGLALGRFALKEGVEPWRPAPEQARALLADADRLAAQGLFVEAAHLILLRSIEDIHERRPRSLGVSLTSRDISRLEVLPPSARVIFSGIAEAVEQSLFGGRPLDGDGFARCRRAYESFVGTDVWA